MKRYLQLAVMLGFCFNLFGQDSLSYYYKFINKAELQLIEGGFEASAIYYDSAFYSNPKHKCAIDFFNASLVAQKNLRFDKVLTYVHELTILGCDMNFFRLSHRFEPFRRSEYWGEYLSEYPELRNRFIAQVNWKLRSEIETIYDIDQTIREFGKRDFGNYTKVLEDTLMQINKENGKKILNIVQTIGFPTESITGVFIRNDTSIIDSPLAVVLRHIFLMKEFDLLELLKNEILIGNLTPNLGLSLLELEPTYKMEGTLGMEQFIVINNHVYLKNNSIEQISKINSMRTMYYASTLENSISKIVATKFENCCSEFELIFPTSVAILNGLSAESEKLLSRRYTKTKYSYGSNSK